MRLTAILKLMVLVLLPAAVVLLILVAAGWFGLEVLAYSASIGAVHAIIALGQATARERGKARWLMNGGLLVSVVAAGAWMWITWDAAISASWFKQLPLVPAILTGWAAMVMVAGMALAQAARGRLARTVQLVTVALAIGLGVVWMPTARAVLVDAPEMEAWGRLVAVMSLLAVAGLVANLVLARAPLASERAAAEDGRRVEAACPRCGHWQSLRLGGTTCAQCELRIKVQLP